MHTIKLLFLLCLFCTNVFSQTEGMKSYSGALGNYTIYYPENYEIKYESDVVKFVNPKDNGLSIAVFYYNLQADPEADEVIMGFSGISGIPAENWKTVPSKFRISVQGNGFSSEKYWSWWCGVHNRKMVVLSVKKTTPMDKEEQILIQKVVDNLDIR